MAKYGRNEPCPCGSGKKYKKCCIDKKVEFSSAMNEEVKLQFEKMQALQMQIEKRQGYGRPIIACDFRGYKFVSSGGRLHCSKKWKTVHDFLIDYLKGALGKEWGTAELKKPEMDMHPIIVWFKMMGEYMRKHQKTDVEIQSAPMTGAVSAVLNLAHNLFLLEHNAKLQERLIKRLKNKEQFQGALYETYVAAILIRAGFKLEFENEGDSTVSHCEFTATARLTKEKYSVEAKSRQSHKDNVGIGRQLGKALKKQADNKRIVFIDVNIPDLRKDLEKIINELKEKETSLLIDGKPAPPAYVIITNHSYEYDLSGCSFERTGLAHGFKIDDFKVDSVYSSLKEAHVARQKHKDAESIIKSIREHSEIPVTFDGEIPEFAFNKKLNDIRLLIGNKYAIPGKDGQDVTGILESATVSEPEKLIYGIYRLENGTRSICTNPITDEELIAYKRHPDTFFGVPRKQGGKAESPLDLFYFFYENYKSATKERLLELMKTAPDISRLKQMDKEELLVEYCERLTLSAVNRKGGTNETK